MRFKVFISLFLSAVMLLTANAPIFASLSPLPIIRSPLNQRDKFDTDLFTGNANYSYPLKVPKGTNNLTPEVTLSYSSAAVRDLKTYLGIGWQLNLDYIERDVNYTPTNTADDKYKLHFKGNVYELVYISSEGRYHTKIESNLNIVKTGTSGTNDYNEYWIVVSPDGTSYRFGYASQSELVCNGKNFVTSWNLDQVTDTHSNKIYYSYTENNGISYLSQIKYNNDQSRIIDFNYSTNPYEHPVHNQGCYAYDLKRLDNIEVSINTTLVREYDIAFGQTGNTQPVLDSITEKGSDRTSLPSTVFYYKPEIHTWNTNHQTWINHATLDTNLTQPNNVIADVNGDGFADIVKSEGNGTNTWSVLLNQGNNTWSTSFQIWVNNQGIDSKLENANTRLTDVTGDGLPDIVKSNAGSGGDRSTWDIWRNTGTSWSATTERWVNDADVFAKLEDGQTALADVNGDGLADIVHTTTENNSTWYVYRNTGNNTWSTTRETWYSGSINAHLGDQNVRLVDVDGDGMPDIVKTVYSGGTWSTWYVYQNSGSNWGSQVMWLDADVDAHFLKTNVTLADANGDGLLDIIKGEDLGSSDRWRVLYNRGGSWTATWENWIDTSAGIDVSLDNTVKVTDVNGDGLADIVKGVADCSCSENTWKVWKNDGVAPHLLASIHNQQGGVISFDYIKAAGFDNTGADSLSDLPFPLWLVQKTTVTNGLTNAHGTSDITTYAYKDGFYKWQDKEFRGFGEVNTTEPNGSKKKYVFHQGDAFKGRLDELQTRDNADNPYAETEYHWSTSSPNGIITNLLDSVKNYTYDGSGSNPKMTEVAYQYDSYGNITKQSEKGDTSTSSDDRFIYNEYALNTGTWLVNSLRHTYTHKSDDSTKVAEKWIYYDNHTWIDDAPTAGDVTKEVSWLDGGTNPVKLFEYDTYGNLLEETDANNHVTEYTYDSATHTYPTSTTNAKNQTTTMSYDLGTGNLLSKTDPNGEETEYEYDPYARIVKEIKPYDSSTYPSVKYQYFTAGVDGTLVSKRETASASGTLDTYTWVDGLNRKIQTRTDAEDPSKQNVVNTFYDSMGQASKESVPHQANSIDYYADPATGVLATETSYDELGRVDMVTNPKGDTRTISYDHWKQTTIDENGHIKREFKNAFDKIVKVEEVNGGNTYTTTYNYDSQDQLTKITDNASNETTFVYDTLGRKTSQVDPDMGTWTYEYDAAGNLTQQTDARNVEVTKTYDELNRLTKTDYPNDTDTTYLYDALGKIGTLSIATDSAGTVAFLYDDRLRKTQEQRSVNGTTKTTQFSYDAADRTTTQTNPDGEVINYAFNAQGEIDSVTGAASIVSNIDYNPLSKITQKAFANGLTTSYTYNTNDFRLNRIQTGSVQDMGYTYDNVGNIKTKTDNLLTKTQNFGYDDLDRLTTASESAGFDYAYQYNSIGNLTKFTDDGSEIDYTYGANGKPHAMTSSTEVVAPPVVASNATASLTDTWSSGSIASTKWLNWGGAQVSVSSQQLTMSSTLGSGYYGIDSGINGKTYDMTGSSVVNKVVNAGNQSIGTWEVYPIYTYVNGDSSNQFFWFIGENKIRAYKKVNGTSNWLAQDDYNSSVHKWFRIREASGTTYFDTSANGITWTNFASVANPFNVTSLVIGSEVGTWDTESSTTTAIFDNFNYATAPSSSLSDDWATRSISSAKWTNWGGAQVDITDEQLTMESTTSSGYYGIDSGVGDNVYNLTEGYVANKLVSAGNQSIGSWEVYPIYAYVLGDSSTQYFWYLSENTLRAYKKVSGSNTVLASASYNAANHKWFRIRESGGTTYFDTSANGESWTNFASTANAFNVTALVVGTEVGTWSSEGSTTTAIFDNFNVWTPAYTYDANGNMTSDGFHCYEFNEANQMKKAKSCDNNQTIAEYVYDFNGNRMVKKTYENGSLKHTITSWSDSYETKVINGGGTENTAYYFANGQLIAKKDNTGNKTYIHNDHLGSTSIITNQSGNVVEKTEYDPWGEIKDGGNKNKFLYTGQEKDNETGLHYYNARYYDPHIRRFTQPDDIIQNAYNPQDLNRYSYVRNNPLKYTDPSGHAVVFQNGKLFSTYLSPQLSQQKKSAPSKPSVYSYVSTYATVQGISTQQSASQTTGSSISNNPNPSSNSNQTSQEITKPFSSLNLLPQKGYLDAGYTQSLWGVFGGSGGIKMDKKGYAWYGSVGLMTKGRGVTLTSSREDIKSHETTVNVSGSYIFAINFSTSLDEHKPILSGDLSGGLGNPGISATLNHTFSLHDWNDKNGYEFIQNVE